LSWDDLKDFVNQKLFPYLKSFKDVTQNFNNMKYRIWEIFYFIRNRTENGQNLREVLYIVDSLNFQKQENLFELSHVYENLLQLMWSDGWNSGEFYTPRAVIKTIVKYIDPQIWQTIYDWAAWSCWFLIEAYEYMKKQEKSVKDMKTLRQNTLFWNERAPLAYVMWVMNMILHWIENPNINKKDTLTTNIKDIEEKDRFDIILANPPFWAKVKSSIQINFPIKTNATEMLFLQHFMKKLKLNWRAWIVVPEWVLFSTSNAFKDIKKLVLQDFNLHTIVSLPSWIFLPYAWVKTNVIFFDRKWSTSDIRYYEIDPGRKLTKNKPITFEEMQWFLDRSKDKKETEFSRKINVKDIKNFDLSAKNPAKIKEEIFRDPKEIMNDIKDTDQEIEMLVKNLGNLI
jgi:type I restriction enzyme M protein